MSGSDREHEVYEIEMQDVGADSDDLSICSENEDGEPVSLLPPSSRLRYVDESDGDDDDDSVDGESGPVLPSPLGASDRSALSSRDAVDVDRHSPYIPENPDLVDTPATVSTDLSTSPPTRSPPPSYTGVAAARAAPGRRSPPPYRELPPIRGSVRAAESIRLELESEAAANSDLSADESCDLLAEATPTNTDASYQVPRLPDVEQLAKNPDDEMEGVPEPPPYNEAVSRLDAGISRQVETTFGADVITGPVRDEPPPDYREIDGRRTSDARSTLELRTLGGDVGRVESPPPAAHESVTDEDHGVIARLRDRFSLSRKSATCVIITCIVLCLLVLFIILFPIQFSYVDYYQYALVRTKSTGRVATDRVYEHGCYVLGADKEFYYLDRTVQLIEFKNFGMFTKDNVDLAIDAQVYYQIRYDGVAKLWADYAGKHEEVIEKVTQSTIRNCAYRVTQEEYLSDRETVSDLIHAALKEKLESFGVDIVIFNYVGLHLPSRVLEKKLKLLLIRTDIEKELAYQQQREIELGTEIITTPIIYSAHEAVNNGTAVAAAKRQVAQAKKQQRVETTHTEAFGSMMTTLSVTNMNESLSFFYLATLNTMDNFAGAVQWSKLGLFTPRGS